MARFAESMTVYVAKLDAAASASIARVARDTKDRIAQEQKARYGVDPGVAHAVDGVRGAEFETVRPDGAIWMGFDYRAEATAFALDRLALKSPVVSGEYHSAHFVLLDGAALPALTPPRPRELESVATIIVTNPLPFARRLETALDKRGRPFVKQGPPHMFEAVAWEVRRAYGQVAKVDFEYVDLANAYVGANALRHYRSRRGGGKSQRVRYPAIVIRRKS